MIRLALLEVRRSPRRFVPLVSSLATVVFLAVSVTALADGLLRASTGALRNTDADLYVFADGAHLSVFRSMLPEVLTIPISHQTGITGAGGMGFAPTSVRLPGSDTEHAVVAVSVSHALPGRPRSLRDGRIPFDGEPRVVTIDASLAARGVGIGDRISLQTFDATVIGIVDDASYLLRPTIWLPPAEFATVRNAALPEFDVDEALTSIIAVTISSSADPDDMVALIDEAFAEALDELEDLEDVKGGIVTVTATDAYLAIPGVSSQQRTLRSIVLVVLAVAAGVTLTLLAVLTLERRALMASLLAAGVPVRAVVGALAVQAAAAAVIASVVATLAGIVLVHLSPETVPLHLSARSAATVAAGAIAAAVIGALGHGMSMRRVDPATELLATR
jgi:ABC-type antimicrobial peptide transport system permease subunit